MLKWRDILIVSYISLCVHATVYAETISSADSGLKCSNPDGCPTDPDECQQICGCDGIYKLDEYKRECVIDYEYLKERTRSNNLMLTENDDNDEDDLASASKNKRNVFHEVFQKYLNVFIGLFSNANLKSIRESTERVFKGIIYSALFIVVCASVCVVSVCVFCCHIHYSDQKLNKDVKTLASKLKVNIKKESIKKTPRDQKEESCNVIVEDANVMCV